MDSENDINGSMRITSSLLERADSIYIIYLMRINVDYFIINRNKTLTIPWYDGSNEWLSGGILMFKILIVEDDKDLNKTVCSFLNHSGYEAIGCLDALDAYDALYKNTFDLIVSDIMMPDVDGRILGCGYRNCPKSSGCLYDKITWKTG